MPIKKRRPLSPTLTPNVTHDSQDCNRKQNSVVIPFGRNAYNPWADSGRVPEIRAWNQVRLGPVRPLPLPGHILLPAPHPIPPATLAVPHSCFRLSGRAAAYPPTTPRPGPLRRSTTAGRGWKILLFRESRAFGKQPNENKRSANKAAPDRQVEKDVPPAYIAEPKVPSGQQRRPHYRHDQQAPQAVLHGGIVAEKWPFPRFPPRKLMIAITAGSGIVVNRGYA